MITRILTSTITARAKKMPVVPITGPRQSGKTTLVKNIFKNYKYLSLENLNTRSHAKEDPEGFLKDHGTRIIIDEAQYVPELFSQIQVNVDATKEKGLYILTGSQNFNLLQNISQSLAGRVSVFNLLPFSLEELKKTKWQQNSFDKYILMGSYPRIYNEKLDFTDWYPDYIKSYIERDVRQIVNVGDLSQFQLFLKLCAGSAGQIVNLSSMGNDIGVSYQTIKKWISILETSFIVYLLRPYYKSFNRRLVKAPKLYFYDTGILCSLLGIKSDDSLISYHNRGAIFENFIFTELIKNSINTNDQASFYYWRDHTGNEIDCIVEKDTHIKAIEIKSGKTIPTDYFKNLNIFQEMAALNAKNLFLIYAGIENQSRRNLNIISWNSLQKI
jgi:predicted AAA+ superfamily ATPase